MAILDRYRGSTGHATGADLDTAQVFDLLSNERRCAMVRALATSDRDAWELGDLAEHVLEATEGVPTDVAAGQARKRVYVSLYQNHVPVLAAADVIETAKDGTVVQPAPGCEFLLAALDAVERVGGEGA